MSDHFFRPDPPAEVTPCPICGFRALFRGDTTVTYGGDEAYRVRRYICENTPSHTTWTTYGPVRDLGYEDASVDAGERRAPGGKMKRKGGT